MKYIAITALVLILAGCASTSSPTPSVQIVDTKAPLKLKDPAPLKLGKVNWIVVTESNVQSVIADFKARGVKFVLFGLDENNYKVMRLNEAQILKLVRQQKAIISAYRNYYEPNIHKNGKGG